MMYGYILREYCNKTYGKRNWILNTNMIVVETIGLYHSQVFRVGENWIKIGFEEFKDLMKRVVYHSIKGLDKIPELNGESLFVIV